MNAPVKSTPSFGETTRLFVEAGITEKALIPIAPHDAEISGTGSLRSDSLGKAPGRYLPRDRKWCGLGDNGDGGRYITEGATAEDMREREGWPTRNAGLLGRYFPAVDSDAGSDDARRLVEDALKRAFGAEADYAAERLRGDAPRRLYAFACRDPDDPDAQVRSWSLKFRLPNDPEGDFPHGLDIIGHGKQFVATGVHHNGRDRYQWHRDYDLCELVERGELARADDAGMADFRAVLVEEIEAAGGQVQSGGGGGHAGETRDWSDAEPIMPVEAIFRGLGRLPNTPTDFHSRDSFVAVLAKIRAALGCEAEQERDAVEAWACEDPGWCDADYFAKAWDSLDRGLKVDRRSLDALFREKKIFVGAQSEFPDDNVARRAQRQIAADAAKRDELVDEFAKTYVLNRVNRATDDNVQEIRRRDDPGTAKPMLAWWQSRTDDLNVELVQKLRTSGRYTPDEAGMWDFVRHLRRERGGIFYAGETMHPNFDRGEIVVEKNPDGTTTQKLNKRFLSPVIRFARKPPKNPVQAAADLEFLLQFIRRLIGPDADYELDTLAYMVQTGKRPGNLLFLVGEPGVGKSTYVQILVSMFDGVGKDVGGQIDGTKLMADSSRRFALAKIQGCRIISIKELPEGASATQMAQIVSTTKQLVSVGSEADYIQIEKKGKDSGSIENYGRVVITSNYEAALRVEQNDRRIFYVRCNISMADRPPEAFYVTLNEILNNPERLATLYRYLQDARDIRGYNPAAAPPVSDAKLEMQILEMANPAERHVAAAFESLVKAGRSIFDARELSEIASNMSDNEYRNKNDGADDRREYDFQAPKGQEQAALRYFAGRVTKLPSMKIDNGRKRLSTMYVVNDAPGAARLVTGADRQTVLNALDRDRDRHPLPRRLHLRTFAYPAEPEAGDDW